jgi:hypothetical protein
MSQPVPIAAPDATAPVVRPTAVAPLPYSAAAEEAVGVVLLKAVVLLAAVMAALGVLRAATAFWIQFSPTAFRGVGTGWTRGTWQAVFGLALEAVFGAFNAMIVFGAAAYFRRRRPARFLLLWGAAGVVTTAAASFTLSLITYDLLQSAGNDLRSAIVLSAWRVNWFLGPLTPALLLLLALTRRDVKRWLADSAR